MNRCHVLLIVMMAVPCLAQAKPQPASLHLTYQMYAAGLEVAQVEAGVGLGPFTYQLNLAYHTTGTVGFFFRGHQFDTVYGGWDGSRPVPSRFYGHGVWHGQDRVVAIDYDNGAPVVRKLMPPDDEEREVVPDLLRVNTIDTISALAELIRTVQSIGRCETTVHTFDGRRATEIGAVTAGEDNLQPTDRSTFAGKALRCDFSGHMLAGFLLNHDRERDSKPLHGSAWLAPLTPDGLPVPVRMTFETRWFGDATMYLTGISPGAELEIAPTLR